MSQRQPPQPDPVPEPLAELFRFRTGVLSTGERVTPVKFIIDGRHGTIVCPLDHRNLEAGDATLFVPDEGVESVQAHVTIRTGNESSDGEAIDRWQAYHHRATAPGWGVLSVQALRLGPAVIDGELCDLRSPLVSAEPRLCRLVNTQRVGLVAALHRAKIDEDAPVCVGVDKLGIDVRCRIGVVRLSFQKVVGEASGAEAMLAKLLG